MIQSTHLRRLLTMAGLLILAFCGLGFRLVDLQVWQHERLTQIAQKNTQRIFLRDPRRGDILDVNGNPLATSVPVKRVLANPRFLGTRYREVAHLLAPLLSFDEVELANRLRPTVVRTNAYGQMVTNMYVDLKRKVSLEQWQQIAQAMSGLTFGLDPKKLTRGQRNFYRNLRQYAIYAVDDQHRMYPANQLASHVIGFVTETNTDFNSISVSEMLGTQGIEAWFNPQLAGIRGWRVTETDNHRREIVVAREQEVQPRPGLNAVLTIDMVVQHIVETELASAMQKHTPVSAQCLVVRPDTGGILALAVLPNYDPNHPGKAPLDHLRNRIVSDRIEPGSTFKIVVVSAALNERLVTLDDIFNCENGRWIYMGRPLKDHDGGYGLLTVARIISKSSNIGAAKIAVEKLGANGLYDYARSFGFGTRTGITLPAETNGKLWPVKDWDGLTISRIPMGQSIGVTHLQMVMAMCAIANQGRLMRPMLVSRLVQPSTGLEIVNEPRLVRQVVSPRAARDLTTALKMAVTQEDGTAPKAALDDYTVAGKTGTAWKVVNGAYARGKYISSFIGFFPADDPKLCISVLLDEPQHGYYGGSTAAPIFKRIAEQVAAYLKLRPDREPVLPATLTAAHSGQRQLARP